METSFRPLAGDLSSLRYIGITNETLANVSVPLQGTYLLYFMKRLCH